jgi:RNA polymerase sigma-70 factor (ECF subfamily)
MVVSTQTSLPDLIEQHYVVLYKYAFRLSGSAADAEDLTQQTFLNAQLRLDQLREPEHVRSWLFTILRNQFLKSVRRKPALPLTIEVPAVPEEPFAKDVDIDSEQLQAALNDLAEDFRIPIILYYFNEFSYRQIAEQLEIPIGTVMSRLSRGKRWLRDRLDSTVSVARQAQ